MRLALLLRVWKPAVEYTGDAADAARTAANDDAQIDSRPRVIRAMSTYAILVVVVLIVVFSITDARPRRRRHHL